MSKEICHRDQRKLDEILEQIKALSDVVDELRAELDDLRKISLNTNGENVLLESAEANNKIDHVRSSVLREVKRYVRGSTATKETCQLAESNQVFLKWKTIFFNFTTLRHESFMYKYCISIICLCSLRKLKMIEYLS